MRSPDSEPGVVVYAIIVGPRELRRKEVCDEFENGLESELLLTLSSVLL